VWGSCNANPAASRERLQMYRVTYPEHNTNNCFGTLCFPGRWAWLVAWEPERGEYLVIVMHCNLSQCAHCGLTRFNVAGPGMRVLS
jgi:hypothetical protein